MVTLNFSSYLGSGPASTVHPKKYQEFQAPPKNIEILASQNIPPFCTLTLRNGAYIEIRIHRVNYNLPRRFIPLQ